jgi:hypothetical protein
VRWAAVRRPTPFGSVCMRPLCRGAFSESDGRPARQVPGHDQSLGPVIKFTSHERGPPRSEVDDMKRSDTDPAAAIARE